MRQDHLSAMATRDPVGYEASRSHLYLGSTFSLEMETSATSLGKQVSPEAA